MKRGFEQSCEGYDTNDIFEQAKEHFKKGEFTDCIKLISSNDLMDEKNPDYRAVRLLIKAYFAMLNQDPNTFMGAELGVAVKLAPEEYFLILDRNFDDYKIETFYKLIKYGASKCDNEVILKAALGRVLTRVNKRAGKLIGIPNEIAKLYKHSDWRNIVEHIYASSGYALQYVIDQGDFKGIAEQVNRVLKCSLLDDQRVFDLLSQGVLYAVQSGKIEVAVKIAQVFQLERFCKKGFDCGSMIRQFLYMAFKNKADVKLILEFLFGLSYFAITDISVFEELVKSVDVKNLDPIYKDYHNEIMEKVRSGEFVKQCLNLLSDGKIDVLRKRCASLVLAARLFSSDFDAIEKEVTNPLLLVIKLVAAKDTAASMFLISYMVMYDFCKDREAQNALNAIIEKLPEMTGSVNLYKDLLQVLRAKGLPISQHLINLVYEFSSHFRLDASISKVLERIDAIKALPLIPEKLLIPDEYVFLNAIAICIKEKQFKKALELISIIESDVHAKEEILGEVGFKEYLKSLFYAKAIVSICFSHDMHQTINYNSIIMPLNKYVTLPFSDAQDELLGFQMVLKALEGVAISNTALNSNECLISFAKLQNSSEIFVMEQRSKMMKEGLKHSISTSLGYIYDILHRLQQEKIRPMYLGPLADLYNSFGCYFFDYYTNKFPEIATEIGFNVAMYIRNKRAAQPWYKSLVNYLYKIAGGNLLSYQYLYGETKDRGIAEFTKESFIQTYFLLQKASPDLKLPTFNKIIGSWAAHSFVKQKRNGKDIYVYKDVATQADRSKEECIIDYTKIIKPSYLSKFNLEGAAFQLRMVEVATIIKDINKPLAILPEAVVLAKAAKKGKEVTLKREEYYNAITNLKTLLRNVSAFKIAFKYSSSKEILSAINILLTYNNITKLKLQFPNLGVNQTVAIVAKIKEQIKDRSKISHLHAFKCEIFNLEYVELVEDKAVAKTRQKTLYNHMMSSYEKNAPFFPHVLLASYKDFSHVNFKLSKICRGTFIGGGFESIGEDLALWRSMQFKHGVIETLKSMIFIEYKRCLPMELYPHIAQHFTESEALQYISKWAKEFLDNPENTKRHVEQYKRINSTGKFELQIAYYNDMLTLDPRANNVAASFRI